MGTYLGCSCLGMVSCLEKLDGQRDGNTQQNSGQPNVFFCFFCFFLALAIGLGYIQ